MMSKLMRATAMAALLSWAVGLSAQQAPSAVSDAARAASEIVLLERKAAEARSQENWSELYESALKLHEQRPYVPSYMIEIIRASAAMGERQTAYEYMLKLQQSGLSYDMTRIPQTAEMRDSEAFQHINNLMLEANKPMGVGKDFLSLPGRPADIGDLAWDASRERFLSAAAARSAPAPAASALPTGASLTGLTLIVTVPTALPSVSLTV